jgi:coenzyme F420 hydrogenase subunit beta
MKAIETVVHLRRERRARLRAMVPAHVWKLVAPYGLAPRADELSGPGGGAAIEAARETKRV